MLLDRLEGLSGGESGQVGRRRRVAAALEITAAKERQAQAIALRQGRAFLRRGAMHMSRLYTRAGTYAHDPSM